MKNILSVLIAIITLNGAVIHNTPKEIVMPSSLHNQELSLSEERIQQAEKAYENEVKWAIPVRIIGGAIATVVTAYLLYHYVVKSKPTAVINKDTWRYYETMSIEEQKAFLQKAGMLFEQNKQLATAHEKNWEQAALNAASVLRDGSWWIVSSLAYQIAALTLMGVGGSWYASIKRAIPTQGSLSWYIAARTNYTALAHLLLSQDLLNTRAAEPLHNNPYVALDKREHIAPSAFEDRTLVQLLILEIEKIIGYLRYTSTHLELKTPYEHHVKNLCQTYTETITQVAHELSKLHNQKSSTKELINLNINRIATEIQRATILIDAFN